MTIICSIDELTWAPTREWPSTVSYFKIRKKLQSTTLSRNSNPLSIWAYNCHIPMMYCLILAIISKWIKYVPNCWVYQKKNLKAADQPTEQKRKNASRCRAAGKHFVWKYIRNESYNETQEAFLLAWPHLFQIQVHLFTGSMDIPVETPWAFHFLKKVTLTVSKTMSKIAKIWLSKSKDFFLKKKTISEY